MKKLLSLLSVLTISSSAIPTTIAASLYHNEEEPNAIVKNEENNNQQINELQTKIESQTLVEYSNFKNDEIFKTPRLYINWNANDYFNKLKNQILKSLLDNGIILNLNNVGGARYFAINDNCPQFNNRFIIPISVERDNQSINIDLVFRISDFYLQGFTFNTTYYHFSDSTITSINGQTPRNLNFDSNYNTLIGSDSDPVISWSGIEQAFNDLINYGENPENSGSISVIRGALGRVVLATGESMRFRRVRENIERTYNQNIQLSWRSDFYSIVTNWSSTTNQAIDYLREHGNSLNEFTHNSNILIFTAIILSYLNDCKNNLRSEETCYEVKMRPLRIYFNKNKTPEEYYLRWCNGEEKFTKIDINLGKINPISYNKINFFDEKYHTEIYSKHSWGDDPHWGWTINQILTNKNLQDNIINFKASSDLEIKKYANKELINIYSRSSRSGKVYFGLTFYWDEKDKTWHLQVLGYLYGESWASFDCGGAWLNIGKGFDLS